MNKELKHAFKMNYKVTMDNLKSIMRNSSGEYTDEQLAKHMGYSVKTINSWMNARTNPDIEEFEYICRLFKCSEKDVIVRNYQVEYPTLSEQRKYFREHLRAALRYDVEHCEEDTDDYDNGYDKFDIMLLMGTIEEIESPAWNIGEMMAYMQLMSPEAIYYLNQRLINIGVTGNDTNYIRKTFKYVIEHKIPDSIEKKDLEREINYLTHRPFYLNANDKSHPLTRTVCENYIKDILKPYFEKNSSPRFNNSTEVGKIKKFRNDVGIQISLSEFMQNPEKCIKKAEEEDVYITDGEIEKIVIVKSEKYDYYKPTGYDARPMYYHSARDNC